MANFSILPMLGMLWQWEGGGFLGVYEVMSLLYFPVLYFKRSGAISTLLETWN